MSNNLRFLSFNCNGALSKLPIISELCNKTDVLFLQETWIMPHDLGIFDTVNPDFFSYSISSVDVSEVLTGRPYGGLTILWRKTIAHICRVITFDDDRLLGFQIECDSRKILAINVYLPYQNEDNIDLYVLYIGKFASMFEEPDSSDLFIMVDFNATLGGRFFKDWQGVCEDYEFIFSDVSRLHP